MMYLQCKTEMKLTSIKGYILKDTFSCKNKRGFKASCGGEKVEEQQLTGVVTISE